MGRPPRIRASHEPVLERATQDTTTPKDPLEASSLRFILFAAAAIVALMGTAVLAYVLLAPDAGDSSARPGAGFVLLNQFHATIVVSPGAVGNNSVDITVGSHDEATPLTNTSVIVTPFEPGSDRPVGDFPGEPVPGSPGAFRIAGLSLPTAGDWSFTVVVSSPGFAPETGTTTIEIASANGG
jgi:hypothetical protein